MSGPGAAWSPGGATRVAAVIGDPIAHSLSPVLHNAAFRALDLDWVYVALTVPPGAVPAALAGMRALHLAGLSVTMPHKDAVAAAVDLLSDDARLLGAVNCVAWTDDRLVGHNTDGDGFVASVRAGGFEPTGRACVVVGAGGAARSVVLALGRAGASSVTVVNRTAEKAAVAAMLAGPAGAVGDTSAIPDADLVVNATSIGMAGEPGSPPNTAVPFDPALIRAGQTIADLVVHPVQTELLREAAARGAIAVDGVGMLVQQAAIAFGHWTGIVPPIEVMNAAARARLG